jgi:Ca2+-binding EF-hand superfamily protein
MQFFGITRIWIRAGAVVSVCALLGVRQEICAAELGRPDLTSVKPQAACALQTLRAAPQREMPTGVVFTSAMDVAEDPLANYARTPLGDWQMPTEVDRGNPWLRFVLFAVERPVVIDVAVFVDGKPYADGREAWIEGVLAEARAAKDGPSKENAVAKPATGVVMAEQEKKTPIKPVAVVASEKKAESTKKEIVAKVAKVSAQSRQAPNMRERLMTYVSTPGPAVDVREVRWLIAEWGFGPPVVVLDASRSWQRAGLAPLFAILDHDRSGALEAAEIAGADEAFRRADADANGVVEEQELRRAANERPVLPFVADHPLVVAIDSATDRDALAADLGRVYRLDTERVEALCDGEADVSLRVDFGTAKSQAAGVALLATSAGITGTATANVITLDLGGAYVEFAATGAPATGAPANTADVAGTQVAVGAAIDGHPFLRLLDADHNHRLTQRERQQLAGLAKSLDRDHDGTLSAKELPIPIRFAVTLGPQVHVLLAEPAAAARTFAPIDEVASPDWFVSMDQNQDRDLSRSEFLGTAEQFAEFDADADGLLSVAEAKKMDVE